jgi:hypothetical protein
MRAALQRGERTLVLTQWYSQRVHSMRRDWDWTSVLSKVMYCGVGYHLHHIIIMIRNLDWLRFTYIL